MVFDKAELIAKLPKQDETETVLMEMPHVHAGVGYFTHAFEAGFEYWVHASVNGKVLKERVYMTVNDFDRRGYYLNPILPGGHVYDDDIPIVLHTWGDFVANTVEIFVRTKR